MTERGEAEVVGAVRRWLDEVVIGLRLCPFAGAVAHKDRVRFVVSWSTDPDDVIRDVLGEVEALIDASPDEVATTLVIVPSSLADFEEYLDVAAVLEELFAQTGVEGVLQVATFHPDYVFADSPADDPGNWTNRAPFPIFHLLREDDVSEAVDSLEDPEAIPARNVEVMRELGPAELARLWRRFTPGAPEGA